MSKPQNTCAGYNLTRMAESELGWWRSGSAYDSNDTYLDRAVRGSTPCRLNLFLLVWGDPCAPLQDTGSADMHLMHERFSLAGVEGSYMNVQWSSNACCCALLCPSVPPDNFLPIQAPPPIRRVLLFAPHTVLFTHVSQLVQVQDGQWDRPSVLRTASISAEGESGTRWGR